MRALPALLLSFALPAFTQAADLELKSLGTAKEDAIGKRKFGPYVGVAMGATTGQKGRVQLGNLKSDLNGHDGAAMISMEVGKSWRMRRIPLMFSLDAEGTFTATSLEGRFRNASRASDPRTYSADMSSLFFTLNGTFALDLWRYRARMGQVSQVSARMSVVASRWTSLVSQRNSFDGNRHSTKRHTVQH